MLALAGAAVVDHARSARRQSEGSGPGLVPLRAHPCTWGEGGVRSLPPHPCKVSVGTSPRARGAPGVFSGRAALYCCCVGVRVPPLLVSVLLRRWGSCWGSCWVVVCVGGGGGLSIPSGVSVAVGDVVSWGEGGGVGGPVSRHGPWGGGVGWWVPQHTCLKMIPMTR